MALVFYFFLWKFIGGVHHVSNLENLGLKQNDYPKFELPKSARHLWRVFPAVERPGDLWWIWIACRHRWCPWRIFERSFADLLLVRLHGRMVIQWYLMASFLTRVGGNKNPATNSVLCQVFKVSHTTWGYSPKIRWCHTSGRFLLLDYPFFCCKQQSKAPFGEKPVKGLQQPPPEHVCSGLGQRHESSCFNWSSTQKSTWENWKPK